MSIPIPEDWRKKPSFDTLTLEELVRVNSLYVRFSEFLKYSIIMGHVTPVQVYGDYKDLRNLSFESFEIVEKHVKILFRTNNKSCTIIVERKVVDELLERWNCE